MMRFATPILAVALLIGLSSPASAQLNLSFGNPITGQGTNISIGQPNLANYGYGGYGYGQPTYVGGSPYGGLVAPYTTGYQGYSYPGLSPYATGTTYYSSGYTGYVAPGTTYYTQQTYPLYSGYGYAPGYQMVNPYRSGYGLPYGGGLRGINRGFIRLR